MKQAALILVQDLQDPTEKINVLREYLQAFSLRSLHESRAFRCLSFVGGTALRFLYSLPRFSEVLDFSLESADGYMPKLWITKIKRDFEFAGFTVTVTWNERNVVNIAWIRVADLMKEAKLTDISQQKLSIKIEIDTKPPQGALLQNSIIDRHMIVAVRHHDLPSLLAGKIHALCTRKFLKARDWYDLLWYGARRPVIHPNTTLLTHALVQTGHELLQKPSEWQAYLFDRIIRIDQTKLQKDIRPFLEEPKDVYLLTKENLREAVAQTTST